MKNILILIFILCSFTVLNAQNTEPTQHRFNWNGSYQKLSGEHPDFKQDEFMLGWQWAGRKRITRAELVRQKDKEKNSPEQEKNMNFSIRENIFLV